MKKNYDYEKIESWARAGFKGAERHAKYTPKRNGENTVNRTESGFFHSFGFQLAGALLVVLIVSGGIFAALKYMERIAGMNNPAQSSESESSTLQEPLNINDIKLFYVTTGGRVEPRYYPFSMPAIMYKYEQDGSVTETVYEHTPDYGTVINVFGSEGVMLHCIYSGRSMSLIGSYVYDESGDLLYSGEGFLAADYLKTAPLGTYLVKLTGRELTHQQNKDVSTFLHTLSDFERISDHALNIAESAKELKDKEIVFSPDAVSELKVITSAVSEIVNMTVSAFVSGSVEHAKNVEPLEECIDELCDRIKLNHVERLQRGDCTIKQGFVLNDLLTDFERVSDHCSNIAVAMIELDSEEFDTHKYLSGVKTRRTEDFERKYEEYSAHYKI